GDAENVGSVNAGAGIPGLHFLEIRNRFGGFAGEVQREAGELCGFIVVWIFRDRALERCDGVNVVALTVINDAKFMGKIFCGWIGFGNLVECGKRFVELALVGEAMNLIVGRRSGSGLCESG